jgi:DNA-binding transcriptional LysR family regulator
MDSNDLRIFEAVARLGGMSRAAEALNTVQSNVTARIRALEAALGEALFERHSRGVALTAAGHRLLPYAERVGVLLADAARAVCDDGTPAGPLIIGALETTAALRLSPLLAAYVRAWPQVDLSLRTGTTAELIDAVLQHDIEGAFVCGPVTHPDLRTEPVFREELVLMSAPSAEDPVATSATGNARIAVLRAGCAYRRRLEDILSRRGVVATRTLEFGTLEAVIAAVSAGLAVTLLPRALIGRVWGADCVATHRLPTEEAMVETLFIRRRDAHQSSALAAFLKTTRNHPFEADPAQAAE